MHSFSEFRDNYQIQRKLPNSEKITKLRENILKTIKRRKDKRLSGLGI